MEPEEFLHALVNTRTARDLIHQAEVDCDDYTLAFLIEETLVVCCQTTEQGIRIYRKLESIERQVNLKGFHLYALEIYMHDQVTPLKVPIQRVHPLQLDGTPKRNELSYQEAQELGTTILSNAGVAPTVFSDAWVWRGNLIAYVSTTEAAIAIINQIEAIEQQVYRLGLTLDNLLIDVEGKEEMVRTTLRKLKADESRL